MTTEIPAPQDVFLDTSIFAGQQFNFGSTAFSTFVPLAKKLQLKLLLPAPTKMEVMRQLENRAAEAMRTIENARRQAPFLEDWPYFPKKHKHIGVRGAQLAAIVSWDRFLAELPVQELDYSDVKIATVMGWYGLGAPPFGTRKKRKEFPDAFAISILSAHSQRTGHSIAVVSADDDFKLACERYDRLLHFPSLPKLTELLVADPVRISAIKTGVQANATALEEAIIDAIAELNYYHTEEGLEVSDVDPQVAVLEDMSIVALGHGECTLAFDAFVDLGVTISWCEREPGGYGIVGDDIRESVYVSGTTKVKIGESTHGVEQVILLQLDTEEVEISVLPWDRYR